MLDNGPSKTPGFINGHMSQTGPKKCFIPQNCRKFTNFD